MIRQVFKKFSVIVVAAILLLSCDNEKSHNYNSKMNGDDQKYKLVCVDETLSDTLVDISIDFLTDSAHLKVSNRIDLGLQVIQQRKDNFKNYSLGIFKLKDKQTTSNFDGVLEEEMGWKPSISKSNIVERFANAIFGVIENPNDCYVTGENDGFGEQLERSIFQMSWFPDFEGHKYTIVEHYQDSGRSWMNVYSN